MTALWLGVLGLVAFDAVGVWAMGWGVAWGSLWPAGVGVALLVGIATFYRRTGRSASLARFADAIALAMALAFACQVATYVLAASNAPLETATLHRWDTALGFSWDRWTAAIHGHPALLMVLRAVYPLHFAASTLAVTVLSLRTEHGAIRYLRAFSFAFLVSAVTLVAAPAITNKPGATSDALLRAIRARELAVVDLAHTDGLISFPSMHAALAVMVYLALWPWRRWRVPLAVFTGAMLVATVSEGGHYLVDVLAGSALGWLAWRVA